MPPIIFASETRQNPHTPKPPVKRQALRLSMVIARRQGDKCEWDAGRSTVARLSGVGMVLGRGVCALPSWALYPLDAGLRPFLAAVRG